MSLDQAEDGKLLVYCFAGCASSDVLAAIRRLGFDDREQRPREQKATVTKAEALREWSPVANDLWTRAQPLRGTLAEKYLHARGCRIPEGDDIAFSPDYKGWPSMISRITCPQMGTPWSLHITALQRDGSGKAPLERAKSYLYGHRKKGGVIRLCRDENVTMGLGIAEGIETALCCDFWPMWATGDADNTRALPVLEGIEALTIFADHDQAGLSSADECAGRWRAAGREARVITPLKPGADWADL